VPLQTGGTLKFGVPSDRFKTNNDSRSSTRATVRFRRVAQPAAAPRRGVDVNANPIRLAFYDLQATEARTKLEIIRVLARPTASTGGCTRRGRS
jgi:hypothetical protein